MSAATDFIGLNTFTPPNQSDRCHPQIDLLMSLRNDNYDEFERILTHCIRFIDINHLYEAPDNKTLLDVACSCTRKAKFVKRLLASGAGVNSLNKQQGKAPIHLAVLYSDFDTLEALVKHQDIDINIRDKEGNTALHFAVQLDNRETISLLLDRGAHVGVQNSEGDLAVKFMNAATLEYLLDRSLMTKGQLLDRNYQIIFDYSLLVCKQPNVEPAPVEETELLAAMSEVAELRPVLKHPVLTSFLDLKWQSASRSLYWRLLFMYFVFAITLTGYIMVAHVPLTMIQQFSNDAGQSNATDESKNTPTDTVTTANYSLQPAKVNQTKLEDKSVVLDRGIWWWWSLLVCFIFVVFRELLQLLCYSKCWYFVDFENYLKMFLFGFTGATLVIDDWKPEYRYWLAAGAIFLSHIELMLLISHHPVVSVNVYMFKIMIWNFAKLITYYAAFVLAFAFSFYIVFTEKDRDFYPKYTLDHVMLNITRLVLTAPKLFDEKELGCKFGFHYAALVVYSFFVGLVLFSLFSIDSLTKAHAINAALVKFVSQAKFIIETEKSAPDLIALLSALTNCCQSFFERLLKRRKEQRTNSQKISSAHLFLPFSEDKKVAVLVNQKNRIARERLMLNPQVDWSCIRHAIDWSVSKSSVEAAKKILSKRTDVETASSSGDTSTEDVTQVVGRLHNRLLALERALKTSEEKLQNVVEECVQRTSLQERIKFECAIKSTEDRLQNVVEDACKRSVTELRKFLGEIVPHARTDADYFYST